MKITKTQLKALIKEAVGQQLSLVFDKPKDSKKAYERLKELERFRSDFWVLEKLGPEVYQEILDLRDESKDYPEFFKKVGPGDYDRGRGRYIPNNKFGMRPEMAKAFWDLKMGSEPLDDLKRLKDEWEKLKSRFKTVNATSQADAVYGRKRTNIVDTETGEVVSSTTDRRGSLGT